MAELDHHNARSFIARAGSTGEDAGVTVHAMLNLPELLAYVLVDHDIIVTAWTDGPRAGGYTHDTLVEALDLFATDLTIRVESMIGD